jgi:ABC-2 type transport system permease protein
VTVAERRMTAVHGPSALGGGWRRFTHLTWLIASTDFKLTYFGSVLGYVWSLARPLMFFGVLYLVFAVIVNFGKGIADFPVLLLMNIVLISFFQEATGSAVSSVITRESLIRKMQFPRLVIPISTVITALFNLALNIVAVFIFMLIYGVTPRLEWLLLPVALAPLVALATGVAMLLSALYVRYRDIAPIWGVISQVLFYASPIFYSVQVIIDKAGLDWARLVMCNPFATALQQAKHAFIDPSHMSAGQAFGSQAWLVVPVGIAVAVFAIGLVVFIREAPRIAEEL